MRAVFASPHHAVGVTAATATTFAAAPFSKVGICERTKSPSVVPIGKARVATPYQVTLKSSISPSLACRSMPALRASDLRPVSTFSSAAHAALSASKSARVLLASGFQFGAMLRHASLHSSASRRVSSRAPVFAEAFQHRHHPGVLAKAIFRHANRLNFARFEVVESGVDAAALRVVIDFFGVGCQAHRARGGDFGGEIRVG